MAKKPTKRPRGRPSAYTKAIAAKILDRLACGESLRRICADDHMPHERTVRRWVIDNINGFSPQYARARDLGMDSMADEIIDIADDGTNDYVEIKKKRGGTKIILDKEAVMRSALRVDARKWYLSKIAPKKYDKPEQQPPTELPVGEEYTLTPDEAAPDDPVL